MTARLIAAVAAIALVAAPPARADGARAAPPSDLPSLPYESYRLPNGLTVILHEDHTAPLVGVHLQYDVGSKDELPGRTGFAHLFEHLMFQGTVHVPKGEDDRLVEAAGGDMNGSTSDDTTLYWEQVPSNALEQMLWLQSDRMGFLLPTLDQAKLDNQRAVVLNERRQNYEMRPYGLAMKEIVDNLWAPDFPYHWLTIGAPADIEAATLADVKAFYERWYGPANAVLSIAGDIDPVRTKALVAKWFAAIPGGAKPAHATPAPAPLQAEKRVTMEDAVQLPRVYVAWQTPKLYAPGDAALDALSAILSDGKSARLQKRLVMDERIAQDVMAAQMSGALASTYLVVATPKPGVPPERLLAEIDEELARIAATPPSQEELDRARNKIESAMIFGVERVGGFGGRAAMFANYALRAGDPGFLPKDLARYRALVPADVSEAARRWLGKGRVVLTVVPRPPAAASPAPAAQKGAAR